MRVLTFGQCSFHAAGGSIEFVHIETFEHILSHLGCVGQTLQHCVHEALKQKHCRMKQKHCRMEESLLHIEMEQADTHTHMHSQTHIQC